MKKSFTTALFIFLFALTGTSFSQNASVNGNKPEHRIIFQLTTSDTTAHKQLMKQLNNILKVSPTSQIEVLCHGAGIDMMVRGKTIVEEKVNELNKKGVAFNVCEFSLKERKVEKENILKSSGFVPAGIIEIVSKQEQGWSYIKAGN